MSGTIAKLTLAGLPFDVASDADFSEVIAKFTNTIVMTSGKGSISQEKRVPEVTGVVIILRKGDKALLKSIAEAGVEIPISYKHSDGASYKCVGIINIENNTTMQNRCSISLLPTDDWTELL
jgi:hypothetical protein